MNRSAFRAKDDLADIRHWPTPRSRTWTSELLESAASDDNILAIVAIGSAVRPVARSVDLDLLVICHEPARLRTKPPIEVDLRAYRADQVNHQLASGNDLLGWAIKFGRVLFQRNGYWDTLLESWQARLPLPDADLAAQRAGEAHERLAKVLALGDCDAADEQAVSYATHLARTELLKRRVYPASRPELAAQLRQIGLDHAAAFFERLIDPAIDHSKQISLLVESRSLPESAG